MRTILVYATLAVTFSAAGLARAEEPAMPEIDGARADKTVEIHTRELNACKAGGGTDEACIKQADKFAEVYVESFFDCIEKTESVCAAKAEEKAGRTRGPQVLVVNGSGVTADAAVCKTLLETNGIPVANIGADLPEKERREELLIGIKQSYESLLPKLKEILKKKYVLFEVSHVLDEKEKYDIVITTGKKRTSEPAIGDKKKADKKETEKKEEKTDDAPPPPKENDAPPEEPKGPVDCGEGDLSEACRNATTLSYIFGIPFLRLELSLGSYFSPLDLKATPYAVLSLPSFGLEFNTDYVNFTGFVSPLLGAALVRDPLYSLQYGHGVAAGLKVGAEVDVAPFVHRPFPRKWKDGEVAKRLRFGGRLSGELLFTDFRPETITRLQLVGEGLGSINAGVFARVDVLTGGDGVLEWLPFTSIIGYWDILGIGMKGQQVTKGTFARYPGLPVGMGQAGVILEFRAPNTSRAIRRFTAEDPADREERLKQPQKPAEKPKKDGDKDPVTPG